MTNLPLCLVHRLSESCQEAKEFLLKHTIGGYVGIYKQKEKELLWQRVKKLLEEGLEKEAICLRLGLTPNQVTRFRNIFNKEVRDASKKD